MSIHYGLIAAKSTATDLSDIEKRLKAVETLGAANKKGVAANLASIGSHSTEIAGNTTKISANTGNISTNTGNISTNTGKISTNTGNITTNTGSISVNTANVSSNTTKLTQHGQKLLKKMAFMQSFQFHYTNPVVGQYNDAEETIRGYPGSVYHPLLRRSVETTIHLEIIVFDQDTTMDGTEKAQFQITFLDSSGNTTNWESGLQTISRNRLINTVYVLDIRMEPAANYISSKWEKFRAFKIAYKPVQPTKVSGNECVLRGSVHSP